MSALEMTPAGVNDFLERLRRDIAAAQLRVILDNRLGNTTPDAVKKLATMPVPPELHAPLVDMSWPATGVEVSEHKPASSARRH